MLKLSAILIVFVLLCGKAWSQDVFAGLKCGVDIPKALTGKRMSNETVAVTESRHKDIGLKDLGASMGEPTFLIGWQICGNEFEMLVNNKTNQIRDVIQMPAHSKSSPEAVGECQINGKDVPGGVIAILDNSAGYNPASMSFNDLMKTMLKAKVAWQMSDALQRFVLLPVGSVVCPLESVVTADGGS